MQKLLLALLPLTLAACSAIPTPFATETEAEAPRGTKSLVGTWDVALHVSETEEPGSTRLVITDAEGGRLAGSFYGTEFTIARASEHRGETLFSAVTQDGSGPYAHSGRLVGRRIEGQTLSVGRDFLMAWTATKVE